jgi:hypothetical protein
MRLLGYTEAMIQAKAGRRVRRLSWNDESYAEWRHGELRVVTGHNRSCPINYFDRASDDWQVASARS